MFRRKKLLILFIILFVLIIGSMSDSSKVLKAAAGEVSLSMPESVEVGEDFNIEVRVKDIKDIYGASLEFNFDSSILAIQDILPGNLYYGFIQGKSYSHFRWIDNASTGKVSTAALLMGLDNGLSSDGSLFILKAKALKSGVLSLKPVSNYIIKLSNSSKSVENKITSYTAKETSLSIGKMSSETVLKEKIEQENPRIQYSGTWYNHFEPSNSGSYAKFTNSKDGSVSFTFEGTGFRWYGFANKYKGQAKVIVDGKEEIVNTYSDRDQYQKLFLEKKGLRSGNHDVKIEVISEYINIDFIEVLALKEEPSQTTPPPIKQPPSPPAETSNEVTETVKTTKKLEQTDVSIQFSGEWLNHWENRNSGGSANYTNTDGAYFQFTFEGTGFKWHGLANKFKGKGKIIIDGKEEIVNTYSEKEEYQKLFYTKEGLANGSHTVKIQTDTDYISIDYIEIIQQTTINKDSDSEKPSNNLTGKWTRFEDNNSSIGYTGSWLTHNFESNSALTSKYTNFTNAAIELSFTGTGFRWYGNANKFKGPVLVTIDDKSERINTFYDGQEYQKLFFEKKGLDYGIHKVKLTLVEDYISLDCVEIENGSLN
jgi:trimeric autotransporter adhesin